MRVSGARVLYKRDQETSKARGMAAGVVETIPDISVLPGEEGSTTKTKLATSDLRDPEQTLSKAADGGTSWSVRNGSLPVAVPANNNQAGPGLHHVESSTTDSGVSNASSVTSDSVPPLVSEAEELLTTTELRLGLSAVERALGEGARDESMSLGTGCEESARGGELSKLETDQREVENRRAGEDCVLYMYGCMLCGLFPSHIPLFF